MNEVMATFLSISLDGRAEPCCQAMRGPEERARYQGGCTLTLPLPEQTKEHEQGEQAGRLLSPILTLTGPSAFTTPHCCLICSPQEVETTWSTSFLCWVNMWFNRLVFREGRVWWCSTHSNYCLMVIIVMIIAVLYSVADENQIQLTLDEHSDTDLWPAWVL